MTYTFRGLLANVPKKHWKRVIVHSAFSIMVSLYVYVSMVVTSNTDHCRFKKPITKRFHTRLVLIQSVLQVLKNHFLSQILPKQSDYSRSISVGFDLINYLRIELSSW